MPTKDQQNQEPQVHVNIEHKTLEELENECRALALDYRTATPQGAQAAYEALWNWVKLRIMQPRPVTAQEASGPPLDWPTLMTEMLDIPADKIITVRKPEEWERPARLLSGVSDGIHPIPGSDWNTLHYQRHLQRQNQPEPEPHCSNCEFGPTALTCERCTKWKEGPGLEGYKRKES